MSTFHEIQAQVESAFTGGAFIGLSDTMGGKPLRGAPDGMNVTDGIMFLYPGELILEPMSSDRTGHSNR